MIRFGMLILSFGLVACDSSDFKGSASTAATAAPPAETIDAAPAAPEQELESKECLLATNGDNKTTVSISHGNVDLSKITPDSVLLLEVQGQAQIDLSALQISSLKGICIYAGGGANIQLDLNTTVLSMFYRSRGNSKSKLDFGTAGTLAKLETDVSGGSQLQLTGEKLACDSLSLPYGGSSKITCNGAAL
ncbi:hypothetical protein [Oligoflexus tunisiensis]|uniref:hypothetical protein n=1 Tax=Oligoflexus tunisiensis TaxID=708132 RepID=UPI00114D2EC9|nr:hypothetical protein [Oligoflexus tunisiensis]